MASSIRRLGDARVSREQCDGAQDEAAEVVVAFEMALRTHRKTFEMLWNGEGHNFAEPARAVGNEAD